MAANSAQVPLQEAPTVANSDIVSLQVSLPQMLDLALGTPEVGAVNFNILHNFLHVLLHQINLQTTKVEYRGENANRIKELVTSLKPKPTLHLQEYSITDATGKVTQRIREVDGIDVDVLAEDAALPAEDDLKVTKVVRQQIGPGKDSEAQTIIFVEPVVNGSTPTGSAFKQLEQSVKQLQKQFQALEDFSTTPEVVERIKGKLTDPVADVWQFININKRLDASEQGIDKLTTMVQDVIKGDSTVATADISLFSARLDELESKVSKMEQKLVDLQTIVDILIESIPSAADNHIVETVTEKAGETEKAKETETTEKIVTDEAVILPQKEEMVNKITREEIKKKIPTEVERQRMLAKKQNTTQLLTRKFKNNCYRYYPGKIGSAEIEEIRRDVITLKTEVAQIQRDLQDLNNKIAHIESEISTKTAVAAEPMREMPVDTEATKDKQEVTEVRDSTDLERCLEAVKNVEKTHGKILHDIGQRINTLEKEVGYLLEKMESIEPTVSADDKEINELVAKIQKIQTDIEKLGQIADKLLDDKESQEAQLQTLLEQLELLKIIKADKEDLEEALANKADAQVVNRKVSHDQFDAACDDLSRGLEEAIDKLSKQESIWQEALDEVQNEIATKVDKIEMTPLKDFINSRLKSLQEKLKNIAEMRRESEAAGTKKLLRDVQCISCDKDVVMKTEEVAWFRPDPLPCTTSMKPYLTYELDQVRKQQRKLPHGRNMIQFEAAMQEEARKIKIAKEEMLAKTPRDHLCNRYCGGSHTITTAQQRVMRVGHFLTQWGPEAIQLTDGLIKGKDGQMYRSRRMAGKLDVCGPTCWESQISEETQSLLSQECEPSVSTPPRKFLQSRRTNAVSQKRIARKLSKEPEIKELPIKPIMEEQQISLQEIDDRLLVTPTEPEDKIVYDANEVVAEE